ncbi:hypothetical protein CDL15_Pgr011122 [Punica granatum]|uniref:non-specific serine/threonine protein kinase n=1 Tax=Punica granatum TaxID=22663 RepID=A0A218XNE6_PUNGR|nr:hypothetical protein CDL15_Pgr011122 [Punica granatum]
MRIGTFLLFDHRVLFLPALVILLLCCFFEETVASKKSNYEACKETSPCGNVSVKYPFWTQNDFCGRRGFQIDCKGGQPFFNLIFGRYHIQRPLANDSWRDFLDLQTHADFNVTCLPDFHYSSSSHPNSSTIHVSQDETNVWILVSFFYNCSRLFSLDHALPLTCSTHQSYVALVRKNITHDLEDPPSDPPEGTCESQFSTTITGLKSKDFDHKKKTINYKRFLEGNIMLMWPKEIPKNCTKCQKSGGWCGRYVSEEDRFQCFCSDGDEPESCTAGKDKSLEIGLGAGIGALAIIVILLLIFIIRNRRMHASSKVLSKNNSAENSLMSELAGSHVYFEVPIFQNKELEEATNNFDTSQELGDGGFGTVYYGKLRDGREVAVKRLYEHNYRRIKQFMTEIQILTRLQHKNLVSLYGCTSRQSHELLLVYEYVPNGTVADHLRGDRAEQGPLPWHIRMNIAIETATALAYLHASDIIHRDVKTNNILLDNNFCVKVGDFGLSRLFPNDVTHVSTAPQGTPGYVDPEYHQCYQLTEKSDVYSFGVVLVELLSSMPAVDISRNRHEINLANLAINRIQKRAYDELIDPRLGLDSDAGIREMMTGVAELAFLCLQQEKEMRPPMVAVVEELKAVASRTKVVDISKSFLPSPESDEAGLLKKTKFPTSPLSVTQKWVSSGSSSTPTASA